MHRHFPGVPNLGDVTSQDWSRVESVDVLTGGYPCQPFSHAGHRRGSADKRHLWPYVRQCIESLDPAIVLLENVIGHLSLGFDRVQEDLTEDGLKLEYMTLAAGDVGAAHTRRRLFMLVYRDEARAKEVLDRGGFTSWEPSVSVEKFKLLPTPTASDYKRTGSAADLRRKSPSLPALKAHFPEVSPGELEFGAYTDPVRQWEVISGRSAPSPVTETPNGWRMSVQFVEWLMGLPEGHVSSVDMARTHHIKMLGNGVVPQQAAYALSTLAQQVRVD